MTQTNLKSLIAGTILATTVSSFALAQDVTVSHDTDATLTPPANAQQDAATKAEIETDAQIAVDEGVTFESNEDVMGAIETDDSYNPDWSTDIAIPENNPSEATEKFETDSDVLTNGEFDADIDETEIALETPDLDLDVDVDAKSDFDAPPE
ncbi:hypothetical protein GCM10009069_14790 [Algimonas arctica]|uniref:Uncharacterized protein n=1 Tax=Algimonas arctica TaxID=1479486 RepID=A0A8J3CSJ1_9PROT|nr:hypothetical protein [Algimonas arctica]GHA92796.1 hypothetical protein GCM10009069_14790 [Algimonas arctica]